ncbi:MAG TPA: F0F1 ATP synthase subunit A [Candidatus Limnocylindria bacterium]|nr:F0F1 ATP synthase subunit A [Candidatus Limnocylindria bacterium]
MASPLEQFRIDTLVPITIGNIDASFTNSSLWMVIAITVITLFLTLSVRHRQLVPGRLQSIAELGYEFVGNMIRNNVGSGGRPYFPFIFTLFVFVLLGNMLGLIPYSFTYTSHIIVTFGMAIVVFIGTTIIAFAKHGFKFFGFFLPHGTPLLIAPVLIPIEILSYFTRPVSLSLRLFANMTAGHTLLKVFGGFVFAMGFLGFVPLAATIALFGLEFLVAFLQAYVFAILTCIYLHDALHMH